MTRAVWLAPVCCALACGSEETTAGYREPVRVIGGQFFEGELPGLPPLTPEELADGVTPVTPRVVDVSGAGGILRYGDAERNVRGSATVDSASVAFRIDGLGTGYWVEPVRGLDPTAADMEVYTWGFSAEYSRSIPPGPHRLLFAAIGDDGSSGTQLEVTGFCVLREVPDNGNVCQPGRRPPSVVVSLAWDAPVDLDLQIFTPLGELLDAKRPRSSGGAGGGTEPVEPGTIALERDSNANCFDDVRRESFVLEEPPSGSYAVYANLFDACGEPSARFTLTLHQPAEGAEPGTFTQEETYRKAGVLLAPQVNGGADVGLYLTQFVVP